MPYQIGLSYFYASYGFSRTEPGGKISLGIGLALQTKHPIKLALLEERKSFFFAFSVPDGPGWKMLETLMWQCGGQKFVYADHIFFSGCQLKARGSYAGNLVPQTTPEQFVRS